MQVALTVQPRVMMILRSGQCQHFALLGEVGLVTGERAQGSPLFAKIMLLLMLNRSLIRHATLASLAGTLTAVHALKFVYPLEELFTVAIVCLLNQPVESTALIGTTAKC